MMRGNCHSRRHQVARSGGEPNNTAACSGYAPMREAIHTADPNDKDECGESDGVASLAPKVGNKLNGGS